MSSAAPPTPKPNPLRGFARAIDWRLVAAVGLPLWAFLIGVAASWKPTPLAAAPEPVPLAAVPVEPPPEPAEAILPPREVVVRTEIVTVPIAVPVVAPGEPVAAEKPEEFALPASEVVAEDNCQTYDTKIRFHGGLPEASAEAKQSKKMLLVLHISGNFDDPGFT